MADATKKLSALDAAGTLSESDTLPISQAIGTRKVTISALRNFISAVFTNGTYVNPTLTVAGGKITAISGGVAPVSVLTETASLTYSNVLTNNYITNTINVVGAAAGDAVVLGVPNASAVAGIVWDAWVSATNTVSVRARNITGSTISVSAATYTVKVIK